MSLLLGLQYVHLADGVTDAEKASDIKWVVLKRKVLGSFRPLVYTVNMHPMPQPEASRLSPLLERPLDNFVSLLKQCKLWIRVQPTLPIYYLFHYIIFSPSSRRWASKRAHWMLTTAEIVHKANMNPAESCHCQAAGRAFLLLFGCFGTLYNMMNAREYIFFFWSKFPVIKACLE